MAGRLARGCVALLLVATAACTTEREPDPCADRFGCVVLEPGEPLVLGTLLVTRGENASLGIDSRNGVVLAVDERKSFLGHPIQLVHRNEDCNEKGGRSGAESLLEKPRLVAVIGTSCSTAAVPAARILGARGILLVSPSNTRPEMTAPPPRRPFYARTAHNDRIEASAMALFIREKLDIRTAAVISDGTPYSEHMEHGSAPVSGSWGVGSWTGAGGRGGEIQRTAKNQLFAFVTIVGILNGGMLALLKLS